VKLIKIPIKCVIQITQSFKTAHDFLLVFVGFITDLNQSTLTRNSYTFIQTFLHFCKIP